MPIVIIARWYPRPERREEFLRTVSGLKDALTPEMAESFAVLLPTMSSDGAVIFLEMWKSEEVMNKLRASEAFHQAIRAMSACCSRPLEIEHLNTVDGSGDFFSLSPIDKERYPPGKADPKFYPDLGAMTALYR
ncbi:MAG: antibiotic biosynthesis monooxygenase [Steroidobacteraceae bacterium]